ncbi:MBL fold metallo-hydrolase [Paenibacillus hamazuiensis]|uniref:MBL fold metallo-hydrolase n=1 Tax=Paenibacillus hamazuiensis TaxID=2936508 RepID=UPI00200C5ADF|nr:MBL fold metallo-hydrolase [Paenibacillus hamazuiensis]
MTFFRIAMLGVGNGFCKSTYHNNALLEAGNRLYLLDCGATAWLSLHELGFGFDDISGIYISHLHYDHCGGLEEAALYGAYAAGRKMKLWLPEPLRDTIWDHYLKGTLHNEAEGKLGLADYFDVEWVSEGEPFVFGPGGEVRAGLPAYWLRTRHVPGKFSSSLVLDRRFFYSADMVADTVLVQRLARDGVRTFYHDADFGTSPVHAGFDQLCAYPAEIRRCMLLMHYGRRPEGLLQSDLEEMKLLRQHEWLEW